MKKLLAVLVVFCSIVLLSGCGSVQTTAESEGKSAPNVVATTHIPEVPVTTVAPFSWDGVWLTDPQFMEVKIAKDIITINIVSTDSKSLFWKGTWNPAAKTTDPTFVSDADVEALSSSIMGSSEKSKPFTYENGVLSFEFSMMGTTKTVHVTRK